jgi:RIO kinase 1
VLEYFGNPVSPQELFKKLVERGAWRGQIDVDEEGWLLIGGRRLLE